MPIRAGSAPARDSAWRAACAAISGGETSPATHSRKPVLQVRGGVVLAAPGGLTGVHRRGLEDAQPRQINVGDLQPASR